MNPRTSMIILWSLIVSFGMKSTFTTGSNDGKTGLELNLKELKLGLDVASTLPHDKNYVISPFNLDVAFSTLQFGIKNAICRRELARLFDDYTNASLDKKSQYLKSSLTLSGVKLNFLNTIFYQTEVQLNPDFKKNVTYLFESPLKPINFRNKNGAVKTINDRVSRSTEGLIKDLIKRSDIDSNTKMVSVNTLFFEATWNVVFNENFTRLFTPLRGPAKSIQMMRRKMYVLYHSSDDYKFKMIAKDYKNTHYKMLVVLPNINVNINDLENKILRKPKILKEALSRASVDSYNVEMPFIDMTSSVDMERALESKDIKCVFRDGIDGITRQKLSMGKMIHKVKFETDIHGSRGAAASAKVFMERGMPEQFIVDRPYLFLVVDTSTGYIHFMGKRVEV